VKRWGIRGFFVGKRERYKRSLKRKMYGIRLFERKNESNEAKIALKISKIRFFGGVFLKLFFIQIKVKEKGFSQVTECDMERWFTVTLKGLIG